MSVVMRRILAGVCLGLLVNAAAISLAHAQMGGGQGGDQSDSDKAAERDKKDKEWGNTNLHLKKIKAEGPCPYVKVLYDAARYEEFQDNKEATDMAKWTGQINGVNSDCAYKGNEPIHVGMDISFSLGRGPKAESKDKVYHYWVAVTERDKTVLAKKEFDLPVTFADGQRAQDVNTRIEDIEIPRADITVSGANFEVLVGFDVTPQMADFNRQGKHFRYVSDDEKKPDAAGQ
jgi:hypothetical protein